MLEFMDMVNGKDTLTVSVQGPDKVVSILPEFNNVIITVGSRLSSQAVVALTPAVPAENICREGNGLTERVEHGMDILQRHFRGGSV